MKIFKIVSSTINALAIALCIVAFFRFHHVLLGIVIFFFIGGISVTMSNQQHRAKIWIMLVGNLIIFVLSLLLAILIFKGILEATALQRFVWAMIILLCYALPSGLTLLNIKLQYFSSTEKA